MFGDGTIILVNTSGHSDGLDTLMRRNDGNFVILFSDGGYATKSWQEMIQTGIALKSTESRKYLEWIRDVSMKEEWVE